MLTRKTPGVLYALALLFSLAMLSRPAQAMTPYSIIGIEGQRLSSIFDGLKPSWFAAENMIPKPRSPRISRRPTGALQPDGSGEFGARLMKVQECQVCPPTTACAGSFVVLDPTTGCNNPFPPSSVR